MPRVLTREKIPVEERLKVNEIDAVILDVAQTLGFVPMCSCASMYMHYAYVSMCGNRCAVDRTVARDRRLETWSPRSWLQMQDGRLDHVVIDI